jgi:hypothetical protein
MEPLKREILVRCKKVTSRPYPDVELSETIYRAFLVFIQRMCRRKITIQRAYDANW